MFGIDAGGRRYLPALDGIRALAVLAVMAFHAGVPWLPGGFLGVDAFFVLSGFLITSLLLEEQLVNGRIRLGAFWGRRARRLLPALFVLLLTVVAVGHVLLSGEDLFLLRRDAISALLYISNWRMLFRGSGGYFAQTATPSPLEHTWSLGIEEQFYLLWPLILVLVLLRRRRPVRAVFIGAVLGALVSAVDMAWLYAPGTDPSRVYYGTDTRASALLVGCALAALLVMRRERADGRRRHVRPAPPRLLGALAVAGAAVMLAEWAYANGEDTWLYRGGMLAAACATAAVIAHAVTVPAGVTARVLSLRPLPDLGRVSYGVYLWHYPVFLGLDAERSGLQGPALLGARFALTFAIATASYVLIESPIRRRSWHWHFAVPATASAAVIIAVAAVGLTAVPVQPSTAQSVPLAESAEAGLPPAGASAAPAPTAPPASPMPRHTRPPGQPPVIDFFGDSVSWTLGAYLPAHPGVVVHDDAMQGCGIAVGNPYRYFDGLHTMYEWCSRWQQVWQYRLKKDHPDVSVILLARWELLDRVHDGTWMHVGQPAYDSYLRGQLEKAIALVSSSGAHVVLLTAPYNRRGERPDGGLWPEDEPQRTDAWNALLRQVAAQHPGLISVIDLNSRVCPDGHFTWDVDGIRIRSDGMHFTPSGVKWIAPWLLPQLVKAAG